MRSFPVSLIPRALALLAVAALVSTACGPSGPSQRVGDTPVPGGRIVIGSISDAKTLNPVVATDTDSSDRWSWLYIGLTRVNKDSGEIEPYLAEKFELSPDGLTLTYTLRDGLVWSDGMPFTGEDYKYTAEAVMRSKKTVRKDAFTNVVGAKDYEEGKTDGISGIQLGDGGKRVTVKFHTVFCGALVRMGGAGIGGILPKHHFIKAWDNKTTDTSKSIDSTPYDLAPPASMGPFVFKEFKPGDRFVATRNDRYFRGAPLVEELVVKVYANTAAVKAALFTGELTYGTVTAQDYDEAKAVETLKGFRFFRLAYTFIGWNLASSKAPWLRTREVRQALTYGLNIDQIIDKVIFGLAKRVVTHSVPVSWAHPSEAELNKYPYDPNKAKQLLEQAGAKLGPDGTYRWTDGRPMQMRLATTQGSATNEQVVQIAQEQYKQIGIKLEPTFMSFPALLDHIKPGPDKEGFLLGWSLGADPDPYPIWHSSQRGPDQFNFGDFSNSQADKLIDEARNGPDCSKDVRKAKLSSIFKILNEEQPYTFLYSTETLLFAQKTLQGFEPTTFSTIWNVEKWWFKQ